MIRTRAESEIIRKMLEAAGDPRRFEMLRWLRGHRLTVQELVTCTGLAQPLVSHHLATLRDSGLVGVEPEGRRRYHFLVTGDALAEQVLAILAPLGERSLPAAPPPRPARTRRRRKVERKHPLRPVSPSAAGFLAGDGTDAAARQPEESLATKPIPPTEVSEPDRPVLSLDGVAPPVPVATPEVSDSPPTEKRIEYDSLPDPAEAVSEPRQEPEPKPEPKPEPRGDIEDFLL